ncbi:hypothetical protein [Paenibacillus sp. GCM10027626]|uniref:hypothetical protein n=1 Tax=Paenibacillus sp. GCM10027626 TaxID=3273411 RepID=UPI00362DE26F
MKEKQAFPQQPSIPLFEHDLPAIDVTARVMSAVRERAARSTRARALRGKPAYIIGLAAVFIVVSGFGYATLSWKLQREDGRVVMDYRQFEPGDEPVSSREDFAEKQALLPEGTAAFFYEKPSQAGEAGRYFSIDNPAMFDSAAQLRQESALPVRVPDQLGDGFQFAEGNFISGHSHPDEGLMEQLKAEAERSQESFAYAPIDIGDRVGLSLLYKGTAGGEIRVFADAEGERWRTVFTDLKEKHVSEAKVRGMEALLIANQMTGELEVMWIDGEGERAVFYKVSTETPQFVSSGQLLAAAEEFVSQ